MKIGDKEDTQYEVEYTAEEVEDVDIHHPPRFRDLWYMDDQEVWHMPSDAPEDLKKEFAAYAWRDVWAASMGIILD